MEDYKLRLKPVKELVSSLQEMTLSVTEADLYRPSSHRTTIIFRTLIGIFCPANYRRIEEARAEATKRVIALTGSSPVNIYIYIYTYIATTNKTNIYVGYM